jgi:hypothetical protein
MGHAVAQLVLSRAASRNAASSIPVGVTGKLYCLIPSGCTMSLESTQPPTEMNTTNISLEVKAAIA